MRNLLQFILKHSNFLLLLLLEVAALLLLIHSHPYQRSTTLTASNMVVAHINEQLAAATDYLALRAQNESLMEENARLMAQLQELNNRLEPYREDSMTDYQYAHLQTQYIPAKVVDLTTGYPHNHLTLNKGLRDGVSEGMGVMGNHGAVGIVSAVNKEYAEVVPIIHTQADISCRIKRNGQIGFTHWDGTDYRYVQLKDIARHIDIAQGDSIVTSGLTGIFPEGILVGIVDRVSLEETDSYYNVRVRLSTDFRQLGYVMVLADSAQLKMKVMNDSTLMAEP